MIRLSTLVAVILSSSNAAADTLAPIVVQADSEGDFGEVRVGDVVLEEYTGSHQRIEAQQLQKAGASLGELLSFETGLQTRQTGAEGSFSSVSIRGSTGSQTPVYWDGMLLNGAANPTVDLSDLELLNVGVVDIYRGSTPTQLGVGGMTGALNLLSAGAQKQASTFKLGTGSFGSKVLQLGSSVGGDQWTLSGTLSSREADNNYDLINNNGTTYNTDDDRKEKRNNAQFERHALLGKLSYRTSKSQSWDLSLQHNQRAQGVPEWRNSADNQASYETETTYLQINRRDQNPDDSNWSTRLGIYQQWRRQLYDDQLSQVGLGAQLEKNSTNMSGLSGYAEHLGERATLALNMDLRHESLQSINQLNDDRSEARRDSLELTAQYSYYSEDEDWLITPSVHFKSFEDTFKNSDSDSATDTQRNDQTGLQFGLRHQLNEKTVLRANVGQHHREPSFYELFGNEGLYVGNDELLPEEGLNIDFAMERSVGNGSIELAVYSNSRDDLITSVFNAQGIGRSINIGKARIQGIELTATQPLPKNIELRFNASYMDSENLSDRAALHGKQLPGLAELDAYFRVTKNITNAAFWLESKALSGKYYDTVNRLPADDVVAHNVGTSWQRGQWLSQAALKNITDERVQDYNGFDKPGRSLQLSLQYRF